MVTPTVWERVISDARLVSLPEAYLQLKGILDQPDFAMADVAVPISQDPALTARLLKLVNSPFYGLTGKIDTVFRAVTMLGTKQVHDLALATAVAQTFGDLENPIKSMREFWQYSVHCGLTAKNLAKACDYNESERIFVAGLLHEIGHLIMYQSIPELCQRAIHESENSKVPLHAVEQEIIGFDYARFGAEMLRIWGLPNILREVAEFHLQPENALQFQMEARLVNLAIKLISTSCDDDQNKHSEDDLPLRDLEKLELDWETCLEVKQQSEQDVHQVVDSMLPA